LYIHIPFCHVKCRFCDFAAFPGRLKDIPRYIAALAGEMFLAAPSVDRTLPTLYFGGGTPSVLAVSHWEAVWSSLQRHFTWDGAEVTIEVNPESATPELFARWRDRGVNRLSFGLQAAQDHHLKSLGRLHDWNTFAGAFRLAREAGFDNLNVDLMFGLPGQTPAEWRQSLDRVAALDPEHISAYALTVEERTAFSHAGVETDGDIQADLYETASDMLTAAGYRHYEISNFARPGRECRHNLRYWRNADCPGLGVSAAWHENGVRYKNTDNLTDYMDAVEGGRRPVLEETRLPDGERRGENLMLGLRLAEGVSPDQEDIVLYGAVLEKYAGLGFLTRDAEGRYRPTLKGWLLSNRLFSELLSPGAQEREIEERSVTIHGRGIKATGGGCLISNKAVRFHPHALERMIERGATMEEVRLTVEAGERYPAKGGRAGFRRNFSHDGDWMGRHYKTKQIEAYAADEGGAWLVITVIVKYF
jgi:oxygen-independent coproporphyrinogen-3 oxidase